MQDNWKTARNHYLAMAALGLALGGLVALFDPGIASAVALPVAFFAAQSAGSKFAVLTERLLKRDEALRLSVLAAALQMTVGAFGIGLSLALSSGETIRIHYGTILALLSGAGVVTVLVTLAGLWFGAKVTLRRRDQRPT